MNVHSAGASRRSAATLLCVAVCLHPCDLHQQIVPITSAQRYVSYDRVFDHAAGRGLLGFQQHLISLHCHDLGCTSSLERNVQAASLPDIEPQFRGGGLEAGLLHLQAVIADLHNRETVVADSARGGALRDVSIYVGKRHDCFGHHRAGRIGDEAGKTCTAYLGESNVRTHQQQSKNSDCSDSFHRNSLSAPRRCDPICATGIYNSGEATKSRNFLSEFGSPRDPEVFLVRGCSGSGFKNAADFGGEFGVAERLGDQFDAGIEPAVMHDGVSRIARGVEHFHLRQSAADFIRQLFAVHAARQHHVGKEQMDGRLDVEKPKRRRTIARLQHAIAKLFQHLDTCRARKRSRAPREVRQDP